MVLNKNIQLNPFSMINDSEICDNVYIGSNSNIGPNVLINKINYPDNVSISNSITMENCEIKSSAIGGFDLDLKKNLRKINHRGNVIIGKISFNRPNSTIDRAVFDSLL